jgi:sugar lactone lactonase YvrE
MRAMTHTPEVLLDGLAFPEGPRWHEGKLWFSDMHAYRVMTVDMDGHAETIVEVPQQPSGLGWLPDGRLLVVSMLDRRLLRLDSDGLTVLADLSTLAACHCNDMVTDARGRSYVGNFGFDLHEPHFEFRHAEVILVEPSGAARVVADQLSFPNGTVITQDGRTMIVGESFAARLTAFDIESDGGLTNRREWAKLESGTPDGICLDAEGAIWVASPVSAECIRVAQGGRVLDRVPVSTQAFACMLGGPARRTLLICTAGDSNPAQCRFKRDGRIEAIEVEVPGAGWP